MIRFLEKLWFDESAVTSVEYALLAAAASSVVGVAGASFYGRVSTAFDAIVLPGGAVATPVGDGGTSGN